MKRQKRAVRKAYILYFLGAVLALALIYSFLAGPLLAWSPLKPGFNEFRGETYSVFYRQGTTLPDSYKHLDEYLKTTSTALDLPLRRRLTLMRVNRRDLARFVPWMKTDGLGGLAMQTGDVLYVSYEKIQERALSEEEFIRHETVHLMHHQNEAIWNAAKAGPIEYVSEGIPFHFGGPFYESHEEFLRRVQLLHLEPTASGNDIYSKESFAPLNGMLGEPYRTSHMLYGEFIGYLISTYGQTSFNAFNHDFMRDPQHHREIFEKHFGEKLEMVLQKFDDALISTP